MRCEETLRGARASLWNLRERVTPTCRSASSTRRALVDQRRAGVPDAGEGRHRVQHLMVAESVRGSALEGA